jgi:hypothetical protein
MNVGGEMAASFTVMRSAELTDYEPIMAARPINTRLATRGGRRTELNTRRATRGGRPAIAHGTGNTRWETGDCTWDERREVGDQTEIHKRWATQGGRPGRVTRDGPHKVGERKSNTRDGPHEVGDRNE